MKRENTQFERLGRLVALLEDWAKWHAHYVPAIGGARASSVVATGGSSTYSSWDDLQASTDSFVNDCIDACVDDLPPTQGAAIQKRYGLCAVWRFPRDNYEDLLLVAHESLLLALPKKGVVV